MPAYAVFILNKTHDAALLEEYRRVARLTIAPHGGKLLIRPTSKKAVTEGSGIEDLIEIEFRRYCRQPADGTNHRNTRQPA